MLAHGRWSIIIFSQQEERESENEWEKKLSALRIADVPTHERLLRIYIHAYIHRKQKRVHQRKPKHKITPRVTKMHIKILRKTELGLGAATLKY